MKSRRTANAASSPASAEKRQLGSSKGAVQFMGEGTFHKIFLRHSVDDMHKLILGPCFPMGKSRGARGPRSGWRCLFSEDGGKLSLVLVGANTGEGACCILHLSSFAECTFQPSS